MRGRIPILALFILAGAGAEMLPVQQVSARMAETRARAASEIRGYTVVRKYTLTSGDHSAEMLVRLTYTRPHQRKFEVLSERGSNIIQKRVFHRLLKEETNAHRHDTSLTPDNYYLTPIGMETVDGRRCYVLRMKPRGSDKFLLNGRVWVDATDFAVVRVEGEPVDTDSFWVKSTHIVQKYRQVDGFWLPGVNESDSDVRLFGRAHLKIESRDYQITSAETEDQAGLLRRPTVE
jgi:outer membrane lipoprotein-sorting protein